MELQATRAERNNAAPPASRETAAPHEEQGRYTIYVGTFKRRENAAKEAARLEAGGLEAIITEHEGLFLVSVGRYSSRKAAEDDARTKADVIKSTTHVGMLYAAGGP